MMLEPVKKHITNISNEVKELHPLLDELFQRHPKISRTEYTHGTDELGADFVLTRTHDVLGNTEHIGVVAKRGKLDVNLDDVIRQIDECTGVRRKIDGGKREVTLSEVWVICTGNITRGAQERIHGKYPGTNVQFVDGNMLAYLVEAHIPDYALYLGMEGRELREEEEKLRELAAHHRGRANADEREATNVDRAREAIDSGAEEHCPTCHREIESGYRVEVSATLRRQAAAIRRRASRSTAEAEKLAAAADETAENLRELASP